MSGYSTNLPITLVQEYNIPFPVAKHLTDNYGGRAHEVCQIVLEASKSGDSTPVNGGEGGVRLGRHRSFIFGSPAPRPVVCQLLVPGYPYLASEVGMSTSCSRNDTSAVCSTSV